MYVQFYIVFLIGYTMTGEVANKSMSTHRKGQSAECPGTSVVLLSSACEKSDTDG